MHTFGSALKELEAVQPRSREPHQPRPQVYSRLKSKQTASDSSRVSTNQLAAENAQGQLQSIQTSL